MAVQKSLLTADDLLKMPDDGWRHELLDGVLLRMSPTGGRHVKVLIKLGQLLLTFV
jgi:Uma2 family endonuclease